MHVQHQFFAMHSNRGAPQSINCVRGSCVTAFVVTLLLLLPSIVFIMRKVLELRLELLLTHPLLSQNTKHLLMHQAKLLGHSLASPSRSPFHMQLHRLTQYLHVSWSQA
jgi:hypothetical protein